VAVRIRVRNFQSIEDAEIVVDGFVAVTGPNNSGKSAFLRAIRALFTNAAPGPFLRTGAAFLSVEMEFEDAHVLWEKGWEKPDGKGKTINRYTVNGKVLSGVGRGVPPEVSDLGVCEVPAGSLKIWPQIAGQFDGALFLLNKSGATMAEALSDVERVGKLTQALRLAEKDRRTATSEMKLRRIDLQASQAERDRFEGLDTVSDQVATAKASRASAALIGVDLSEAAAFKARFDAAFEGCTKLDGFAYSAPLSKGAEGLQKELKELIPLSTRLTRSRAATEALGAFAYVAADEGTAPRIRDVLTACRKYSGDLSKLQAEVDLLSQAPSADIPSWSLTVQRELPVAKALRSSLEKAASTLEDLELEAANVSSQLAEAETEAASLLVALGVCPTCQKVTGSGRIHEH